MSDFPLTFTELAKEKLATALKDEPEGTFVRAQVAGGGCSGFTQTLSFDTKFDAEEDLETTIDFFDETHNVLTNEPYAHQVEPRRIRVVCDSFSALYLKGTELDFVMEKFKEGFKFVAPLGAISKTCGCGASVSY